MKNGMITNKNNKKMFINNAYKYFLLLLVICFLCVNTAIAQNGTKKNDTTNSETLFLPFEEDASFPGGYESLITFIKENLKYPQEAKEKGIQGRVPVTFVVERDGSITNIKLLRKIGYGCDEEAIRIIKLMPKWKPSKLYNSKTKKWHVTRQQFNLPIQFELPK